MMGRILGRHASVFTFHELHFFEQLWSPTEAGQRLDRQAAEKLLAKLLCVQRDGYLTQGDPARFSQEAAQVLDEARTSDAPAQTALEVFRLFLHYEATRRGAPRPCDQTPRNVLYGQEILDAYPEAQVIHMVRDARDVLLSQKRKWRRHFLGGTRIPLREALRARLNYHPLTISMLWQASVQHGGQVAAHQRVCTVRFEDLVADPAATVQRVCAFLGLAWDPGMLAVPRIGSSNQPDEPDATGIDTARAGRWSQGGLSRTERYLCQRVNAALLGTHGYPRDAVRPNPVALAGSLAVWPLQVGTALAINVGRMRNIRETLRRRLTRTRSA